MATENADLNYTFAFCMYRRRCVAEDEVGTRLRERLEELAAGLGVEVLDVGCAADCVQIRVAAPAEVAPDTIATTLKDGSERALRAEYRELRALSALWTAGYLATTAGEFERARLRRFVEEERQGEGDERVLITPPQTPRTPSV
jgi:REP element-mobilizing transposase RayT